jgi:hypothetical protein
VDAVERLFSKVSSLSNITPTHDMTPEEEFQDHDNPDFGPRFVAALITMVALVLFVAWRILSH